MFPGHDGRMRSPEADPQKVLRTALAGPIEYWVHTCRRCKRRGEPHSERHADGELRPCPRCGMKLWPTAKVRAMRSTTCATASRRCFYASASMRTACSASCAIVT